MRTKNLWIFWLLVGLTLSTTTAVLGEANVALIKVLKGTVKLDGKTHSSGCLAADGQTLEVPAGARVSIKLLQNAAQMEMSGPETYKIDSAQLKSDARMVKRGDVEVAASLGSDSKAAGLITRSIDQLKPQLVAEVNGQPRLKLFPDKTNPPFVPGSYLLTLREVRSGNLILRVFVLENVQDIALPAEVIETGESYEVSLASINNTEETTRYSTRVRILSDEQRADLESVETVMRARYEKTRDITHLLSLAEILISYDQNIEAFNILNDLKNSKTSNRELSEQLKKLVEDMRFNVLMPLVTSK